MPEFGRRNASAGRIAYTGAAKGPSNLSAAIEVAKTGKLPYWTKVGPVRLIVGIFAIAAAYVFVILPYASDIWRDHHLAGSWQAAYDMQATDGKCTRHNLLVTDCSAKVKSLAEPKQAATEIAFMMAFASGSGERLVPVRSARDPSVVTIAYAAETELWNRTLTFLVLTVAAAAAFLACAYSLLRGRYQGGAEYLRTRGGAGQPAGEDRISASARRRLT